ncbi:DJ-1/PfpI family protein [Candidatus Woesearchaeota archaeon]|nr:DJ-1/PfpI family protein [Candidatus Woesearchaeota archaeon]
MADKKAVMIVAPENFRDEECFEPKKVLEDAGVDVKIASKGVEVAKGKLGGTINVDLDISEVDVNDYDAVIFIGGPGSVIYQDDETALNIARDAVKQDKILAAICIAPVILAKAGVLEGKIATAWDDDKLQSKVLKEAGATFSEEPVVVDEKLITANGPAAAKEFGKEIVKALG